MKMTPTTPIGFVLAGVLCLLVGCVAQPETTSPQASGSLDIGQACSTSGDCSVDLRCMSIDVGRVCVQPCQATAECSQAGATCTPVPGLDVGWCDGFETPPQDNPPVDEPPVDEPPVDEPPVDEPPGPRATYPSGPYGTAIGDTIEDLPMIDSDGSPLSLGDFYADEANKVLIIYNTVAYCQSCAAKTAELTALNNEYGSRGLMPVVPLYENTQYLPAEADDAAQYKTRLGLQFPVTADGPGVFHRYFSELAYPMVMIIDVETMTILYKETSWQRAQVDSVISGRL